MTKKQLLKELEKYNDNDNLMINNNSWFTDIEIVCGKRDVYQGYTCVLKPNHKGDCYCQVKKVDFVGD